MDAIADEESAKVTPVKKFGALGLIAVGYVTFCRCYEHIMILMPPKDKLFLDLALLPLHAKMMIT